MATVNDNYPKKDFEMSDEQIKALAIQNMQRQEVKSSGFPTEMISLPSKGLVYPEGSVLREGKIEMKYMTAREEDILTSQNLIKQGVVIDKLMKEDPVEAMKITGRLIDYVLPKQTKIDLEGEINHKIEKVVIEIKTKDGERNKDTDNS